MLKILTYSITGLMGCGWTIYLTMMGLYGVRFSPWFAIILAGSLILVVGSCLEFASRRDHVPWMPLVGSSLLASYFLPAGFVLLRDSILAGLREPVGLVIRLISLGFVITSLMFALKHSVEFAKRNDFD